MDITDVIKRAQRPERTADICLNSDLVARHEDLRRKLASAGQQPAKTMADTANTSAKVIAGQIEALEQEMRASTVVFRMRGLSSYEKDVWEEANPPRPDKRETFNPQTAVSALVAASCVAIYPVADDPGEHPSAANPVMTDDQAKELLGRISDGQATVLWRAAWEAMTGSSAVPFSVAASETLAATST